MAARILLGVVLLGAVLSAQAALAQETQPELTPAGKAMLKGLLSAPVSTMAGGHLIAGPNKTSASPRPVCMFRGGLCGAVNRDGTVAVPPRYDWVGEFFDGRAAVRVGGLYGFVDESGREIVTPQYRIVDDYKHGFAQVDVDGKSGLIDREGKMVVAPKYGFIEAIAPDRFRVSEERRLHGRPGSEAFSRIPIRLSDRIPTTIIYGDWPAFYESWPAGGVIDISGRWIEQTGAIRAFENDNPSIRWVQMDKLWGLARPDGSWLIEPKFQNVDALSDGLARVTLGGKIGFVDRTGRLTIEPAFDKAQSFVPGLGRTSATRGDVLGVIDKTGAWVFQTSYQELQFARIMGSYPSAKTAVGWHFKKAGRWGLLDLDSRVVIDADFDVPVQLCAYGGFLAVKNKEMLRLKQDGSPLQPGNGRVIDAGCTSRPPYTLSVGGKFGLIDAEGNPVTPVHFDAIAWTGAQFKNVKFGGKWGRIALDGRWLLEAKFDYLSNGADLFVAALDGKRGFMRSDGTWLIEPRFDAARVRNAETAFVTVSGATGLMRLKDQSWIIAPRPGTMCDISHGILSRADGKRVILSEEGETWIDIGGERIGIALDLGLLTFERNGKTGLVDTAGQVTVEPQFDVPVFFFPHLRGIAWTKIAGRWCAIDRRGKTVPGIACADAHPTGFDGGGIFPCSVEH